jgi:hypothetical protein
MSDQVTALRPRPSASPIPAILAAGIASSLLYILVLPSFAFLVPVQIAYGRSGRRAGTAAAGLAAAVIAVVGFASIGAAGGQSSQALAAGILPSLFLLGAIALANAPIWKGWTERYRVFFAAAACSICALPVFARIVGDASFVSYVEKLLGDFMSPLKNALGDGYDASAVAAAFDPKELVSLFLSVLRNSYAAILLIYIGGSLHVGNRLAGPGSRGRQESLPIDESRLPYPLLWAFLVAWTLVLASTLLHAPEAAAAVAWNCALALSLAYAAQGLGIATSLFKKWNMPRGLRIATAIVAAIAMMTPTAAGLAVAVALPLLGVTEIWIPYRKPKGVGA